MGLGTWPIWMLGMPTLRVMVLPSIRLAALLCALHLVAGALVCWLALPLWLKAAFVVAVAWRLRYCLDEVALLRAPRAIVAVAISGEGTVIACTRGGAVLECELLPSSFVSYRFTVLHLRPREGRRAWHVVLCCGNINSDDLRRLRVWLRWAAGKTLNRIP